MGSISMKMQSVIAIALFSIADSSRCYECLDADSEFRPAIQDQYSSPWRLPGWDEHYWKPEKKTEFLEYFTDLDLKIIDVRPPAAREELVIVDHFETEEQKESFRNRKQRID